MPVTSYGSVARIESWTKKMLRENRAAGIPLSAMGFERVPQYLSRQRLESTLIVLCDELPYPEERELAPYTAERLSKEHLNAISFGGLLYVRKSDAAREDVFIDGLVVDCQVELLGMRRFIFSYLFAFAFEGTHNPLPAMAKQLVDRFRHVPQPFDLEGEVKAEIGGIIKLIDSEFEIARSLGERSVYLEELAE